MSEAHSIKSRVADFWTFIRSPWVWPLNFAFAFFVAKLFPAVLGKSEQVSAAWSSLWADVAALPDNPFFELGFIVTALACAWQGVRRIEASKVAAIAREGEIRADERAAIEAQLRAPNRLINDFIDWKKLETAQSYLADARRITAEKHAQLESLKIEPQKNFGDTMWESSFGECPFQHAFRLAKRAGEILDEQVPEHGRTKAALVQAPHSHHQIFEVARNDSYFTGVEQDRQLLVNAITGLERQVAERQEELQKRFTQ